MSLPSHWRLQLRTSLFVQVYSTFLLCVKKTKNKSLKNLENLPSSTLLTKLTQTLMSERRCGRKEMIGCRCRVRQIPSIRLLAASHSTCLLEEDMPPASKPQSIVRKQTPKASLCLFYWRKSEKKKNQTASQGHLNNEKRISH